MKRSALAIAFCCVATVAIRVDVIDSRTLKNALIGSCVACVVSVAVGVFFASDTFFLRGVTNGFVGGAIAFGLTALNAGAVGAKES